MSTTSRVTGFEDLKVYQRSRSLVIEIYQITRQSSFSKDYALRDQIHRACISISSNIAEGSERGSTAEFIQFLYISKASCAEVRAHLNIAKDLQYIKSDLHGKLSADCKTIGGMLANLIAYLRNSSYRGYKYK
jgi:four helix bundle protein